MVMCTTAPGRDFQVRGGQVANPVRMLSIALPGGADGGNGGQVEVHDGSPLQRGGGGGRSDLRRRGIQEARDEEPDQHAEHHDATDEAARFSFACLPYLFMWATRGNGGEDIDNSASARGDRAKARGSK